MSAEKHLKGVTRHLIKFYHTYNSYPFEDLKDALEKRGYEIKITDIQEGDVVAEVYLTKASDLIPLVSLSQANEWNVGYENTPNKRLITIYFKGALSLKTIDV
ncbi:MAG: hypothetical protein N3D75_03975 [Candidatus Aenigmarchaeota archaeon]|nr:hypothetical protein [Candidatus Aenigmarchaeota archaeon]